MKNNSFRISDFRKEFNLPTIQSPIGRTPSNTYWKGVWRIRRWLWSGKLIIIGAMLPAITLLILAGIRQSYMLLIWGVLFGSLVRILSIVYWIRDGSRFGIPLNAMLTHRVPVYYISELFILPAMASLSFLFWKPILAVGLCLFGVSGHYLRLYCIRKKRSRTLILILRRFGANSLEALNRTLFPVISHVGMPVTLTEQDLRPRKFIGLDLSGTEHKKVENGEWHDEVLNMANQAKAIILDISEMTPAIQWERQMCITQFSYKTILISCHENPAPEKLPVLSYCSTHVQDFQERLGKALGLILTGCPWPSQPEACGYDM